METSSMRTSYKLSDEGIAEIDHARRMKGWKKMDKQWVKQALSSESTLKRFLSGVPISAEHFISLCKAVGIEDWQKIVDWEDNDSTRVPVSVEEKLSLPEPKVDSSNENVEIARHRLAVSAVFDPDDLEEIEIVLDHLSKLIKRGTVTIKTHDGREIKEIRHPRKD
jgi:hypothetical protein